MEKRELICIGCPLGCTLTVEQEAGKEIKVTGNTCPRGAEYARKEVTNPSRTVTTTVRVKHGEIACIPVKTAREIPKDKIKDCIRELKNIEVMAPICIGAVIIDNIAGTTVQVVATKTVKVKE